MMLTYINSATAPSATPNIHSRFIAFPLFAGCAPVPVGPRFRPPVGPRSAVVAEAAGRARAGGLGAAERIA